MNAFNLKSAIEANLHAFSKSNLLDASNNFFRTLGYHTNRTVPLSPNTSDTFRSLFDQEKKTRPEIALFDDWLGIDLLFQITATDVVEKLQGGIQERFVFEKTLSFEGGAFESYLFFAIHLKKESYTRTQFAGITREINKLFKMPVMVLFKYGNSLTLSVIDRRLHKRDETKDVLEKVTLIKDINIASPHRAHIEILFDLSLPELTRLHSPTNFLELHEAWRKTLNISELNKKFYKKIAAWYFWAVKNVEFPMAPGVKDKKLNSSINVIRLLTRLIFVWFLKEKHLVPDDLFDESKLARLLKNFNGSDPKKSDYYKAILQNLFFATLNQKMNSMKEPDNRRFATDERDKLGRADDYNITNLYRYKEAFQNLDDALKAFSTIPFLNGGLFDCLDRPDEKDKRKVIRIDGFSRVAKNQPTVPNILFFGGGKQELEIDLSDVYDDKKHKRDKVKGLIHILNDYKFTIAENTPVEEEIALDPELLGRIFENLLAEYNPETGTTARKATGSFYTPREIVNYMVDESLIAYLKTKLEDITPAPSDLTPNPSPKERGDAAPRYMTTDAETWKHLKPLARALRSEQTEAEEMLWQRLRDKQLGAKFRRQHAIAEFIVDFVCIEHQLVVELDGEVHKSQKEYDEERTRILESRGFRVIRFWNDDVMKRIEHVLTTIKTALTTSLPRGEGSGVGSKTRGELSEVSSITSAMGIIDIESRLRHLVSYSDDPHHFSPEETDALIEAIHTMKVLDPACGSGAFPMGVLLKVVHILHKLDPENRKWKRKQIDAAEQIPDSAIRQETLENIEEAFSEENNFADYGRKLYLIENCIYGVDIQPIATQIAKLRFFISLLVDQRGSDKKENRGVLSLPNLETKFVAANTLLGLGGQDVLKPAEFHRLEEQLKKVRHDYFNAKTRRDKMKYMAEDKKLRGAIAESLRNAGMPKSSVDMLAHWDPYDQNVAAGFFSPEWMFGNPEGFDIVLGNPPYLNLTPNTYDPTLLLAYKTVYESLGTAQSKNLFVLFVERALRLVNKLGTTCMIVPEGLSNTRSYTSLRRQITRTSGLLSLLYFDESVFENTVIGNIVFVAGHNSSQVVAVRRYVGEGVVMNSRIIEYSEIAVSEILEWKIRLEQNSVIEKLSQVKRVLRDYCQFSKGMVVKDRENHLRGSKTKITDYPFVLGKDISRFSVIHARFTAYGELRIVGGTKSLKKHLAVPRLLLRRTGDELCCAFSNTPELVESTLYILYGPAEDVLKYLLGIINSTLMTYFVRQSFVTNQQAFPQILLSNVERIPVPEPSNECQKRIHWLVDQILAAKKKNPKADTSALEREIDVLVYNLYNLTYDEVKIVDPNFWLTKEEYEAQS